MLIRALFRRSLTVPVCIGATLFVTAASPILLVICALLTLHPACRGAIPTFGFILGYLWCETLGILSAFYLWLRHRDSKAFLAGNYRLQCWWASTLKLIAQRFFDLHFEVSNPEALKGPGALVFPRHTSIADTLIPMVFYAIPEKIRLRYVLKKELIIDPCLDIVGHRLPNFFIDRGAQDSNATRSGLARLTHGLTEDEGILLYPEGTRFTQSKRARLQQRAANDRELEQQLARWPSLMPPKPGGFLTLLEANPGRDLIFCGHAGFEGSSHVTDLFNGSWQHAWIRICFWRVPFEEIPTERAARIDFLFHQWDVMQEWVSANS